MTTGNFWNTDNPKKPWGEFDTNAELVFPIDVTDWLAEMATTYSEHQIVAAPPLDCSAGVHAVVAGRELIYVRAKLAAAAQFTEGTKYPFTVRLIGANGPDSAGPQQDDRTLWLKLVTR